MLYCVVPRQAASESLQLPCRIPHWNQNIVQRCFHVSVRRCPMVLRLFRALMPKEERFIDYFCEHSEKIVAAADALHTMLANGGDTSDCFHTICVNEGQA